MMRESTLDEINGAVKDTKDPLSLQGGPITRVKAKKMRETLNGLIEDIQAKQAFTDASTNWKTTSGSQAYVHLISMLAH